MAVETEAKKKFIVHTLYYANIAGILVSSVSLCNLYYYAFSYCLCRSLCFKAYGAVSDLSLPLEALIASAILVVLFYGTVIAACITVAYG